MVASGGAPERDERPRIAFARQVTTGLAKIGMALRSEAWRRHGRGDTGLTPTQAQILARLAAAGQPLSLRALAADLGITPASASDTVRVLAQRGLVTKARAAGDGRALAIGLTAAGVSAAEAAAAWPDLLAGAVDALTPDEQAVMLRALTTMIRELQLSGRISVQRMCASCVYFLPNAHPGDPDAPHHCAYVDAPFGDRQLRLDCTDHQVADADLAAARWAQFSAPRRILQSMSEPPRGS